MEKVIWIIGQNRNEVADMNRKLSRIGGFRALCMLSFDALNKTISTRLLRENAILSLPSAIVIDYDMVGDDDSILNLISSTQRIAGVPLIFMVDETIADEDDCYAKGAMLALHKPLSNSGLKRITRTAWQYENTRTYEQLLHRQTVKIQESHEIRRLNEQLENRNEFLHRTFGKYFSDEVMEHILNDPSGNYIGGEKKNVAVLMADIRGFTALSDELNVDELTSVLNIYFETMVDIISKHQGTVIEYMGDGILAVFGAPIKTSNIHASAILCAIEMQNAMAGVNTNIGKIKDLELSMGIGVHCGETFVGNIGSERMMRFNVIGQAVNECSRIEGKTVGGQIFTSQKLQANIEDGYEIIYSNKYVISAKGVKEPLEIIEVDGITGSDTLMLIKDACEDMSDCDLMGLVRIISNKRIYNTDLECKVNGISRNRVSVEGKLTELEIFDEVEIAIDIEGKLIDGNYAKVTYIDDLGVELHFTHKSRELENYFGGRCI